MNATAAPRTAAGPPVSGLPPVRPRSATSRWRADAAGVAVWSSLLVVTALWVSGKGVQGLGGGAAAALSSVGRLTGLLAADLLLLQVLAMARIPLVERAFGQDRLARWHRWTGFTSFHLMAAHIVFIAVGYAGGDGVNVLAELWDMIVNFPGMLLATAGTALLVLAPNAMPAPPSP